MPLKVFIYGTLKRGFPLHEEGMSGTRYLENVRTLEPYPLYIAGSFFGPMMLDRRGEGLRVDGELFEVGEEHLPVLDRLEDVGSEGSFRGFIDVVPAAGGRAFPAMAYFKSETWLKPLHDGPLSNYHDRRFVPPWDR